MSEWICPRPKRLKIPPKNSLSETRCLTDMVNAYTNFYYLEPEEIKDKNIYDEFEEHFGPDSPYYWDIDTSLDKLFVKLLSGFQLNHTSHYSKIVNFINKKGNIPPVWNLHHRSHMKKQNTGLIDRSKEIVIPYLDIRILIRWMKVKEAERIRREMIESYERYIGWWDREIYYEDGFVEEKTTNEIRPHTKHRKDRKGGKTEYREKYGSHNKKTNDRDISKYRNLTIDTNLK